MPEPIAVDVDLSTALPGGWQRAIDELCTARGIVTLLGGRSATTAHDETPTSVRVVTGDVVAAALPWLWQLYSVTLLEMINDRLPNRYVIDQVLTTAINVNRLEGPGARYERHRDSNDLTGLLMVSNIRPELGGVLRFWRTSGPLDLPCTTGRFLAFDARDVEHEVLPLADGTRITIPMNYYLEGEEQTKPADILEYLYTDTQA